MFALKSLPTLPANDLCDLQMLYRYDKIVKMENQDKIIQIAGSITVDELAQALGLSVTALIGELFKNGIVATINQRLDFETAQILIDELKIPNVKLEHKTASLTNSAEKHELSDHAVKRPPVVAVMGHVDHGKTTLLDTLLHKKTVDDEAGGITQHISAYQLKHDDRMITFLDTPGHEAFAAIRQHGALLTDIVVIVVAADDGVKPQTVEAINFAKDAHAKIIVAINKIDREGADIPRTMADLSEHGLQPEEWGGDTVMVPISAKNNQNLDKLLDMILLTADLEDLKADIDIPAEGLVIESHLETGKGSVVNLLVTGGELKTGEFIVAGKTYAKVRTMLNFEGRPLGKATPSVPIVVTGFKELPNFGDRFIEVKDEKAARKLALLNAQKSADDSATANVTSTDLLRMMNTSDNTKTFNVIVKGDVLGSVTSVVDSLKMIDTKGEITLNIVSQSVGDVTENDIYLAEGDKPEDSAVIYGFNVRPDSNVRKKAQEEGVDIRLHNIIYKAVEEMEAAMKGMLAPVYEEVVVGQAEVRKTYKVSKIGTIAGCMVVEGKMVRDAGVRLIREGIVIYTGKLGSLKRFENDAKEVSEGYECGMTIENYNDIKEGDIIEAFVDQEVKE